MSDQLLAALNACHPVMKTLSPDDRTALLETLTRLYILRSDQRARLLAMVEASDTARNAWQQ